MNQFFNSILTRKGPFNYFRSCRISTGQWNFKGKKYLKQLNPGLDGRLSMFKDNIEDTVEMEDLETDFWKAGNMYTSHTSELETSKEKQKLDIVKRKYFKQTRQPNFLTWAEKEQIRHLHRSDPVEWTAEKLCQSFPASEMVIKNIIKSKWKLENHEKVAAHDKSVEHNWIALERNQLQVDVDIKNHILKFANRDRATLAHNNIDEKEPLKLNSLVTKSNGDFLSIIKSYKVCAHQGPQQVALPITCIANNVRETVSSPALRGDSYILDGEAEQHVNKKSSISTLEKYRESIGSSGIDENRTLTTNSTPGTSKQHVWNLKERSQFLEIQNKFKFKDKVGHFKSDKQVADNRYDEHITIPRNKWKEGGTYKVGECYYDDDGEFLYRVPGMK